MALLTVAQIAKQLKLPESTARYYRDRFAAFIPTVGTGRTRRYPEDALEVFAFVAEQMRAGTSTENVEAALASRFPLTAEPQAESQDRNDKTATTALEPFAGGLGQALVLKNLLTEALGDALAKDRKALAADLESLRAEMREAARQQQEREEALLAELGRTRRELAALRETQAAAAGHSARNSRRRWWWPWGERGAEAQTNEQNGGTLEQRAADR